MKNNIMVAARAKNRVTGQSNTRKPSSNSLGDYTKNLSSVQYNITRGMFYLKATLNLHRTSIHCDSGIDGKNTPIISNPAIPKRQYHFYSHIKDSNICQRVRLILIHVNECSWP